MNRPARSPHPGHPETEPSLCPYRRSPWPKPTPGSPPSTVTVASTAPSAARTGSGPSAARPAMSRGSCTTRPSPSTTPPRSSETSGEPPGDPSMTRPEPADPTTVEGEATARREAEQAISSETPWQHEAAKDPRTRSPPPRTGRGNPSGTRVHREGRLRPGQNNLLPPPQQRPRLHQTVHRDHVRSRPPASPPLGTRPVRVG